MNIYELEKKATPGPWTAYNPDRPNHADKRIMILHPDGERLICRMGEGICGRHERLSEDECKANTAIIAHKCNHFMELLEAAKGVTGG